MHSLYTELTALRKITAKNNWLMAQSDMLQARYECLFQTRLLDFYRGEEIVF